MAKNTQKVDGAEDIPPVLPPEDTAPQGEDQEALTPSRDESEEKQIAQKKKEAPKTVTLKCDYPLVRINGEYITSINGEITVSKEHEAEAKKICG